ncbi:Heptosyltransferase II [Ignavibacterium album JCM 16511]|uniref:Heptosyltransferase II n=1 Tax=Ignavibacterium album (strain DSM 19864 / JCM 16511 / NBRC 101810 / Mat9-16) TaxID=945713 RepID=I0AHL7_IGNAJ|nr:glycosyltransferase family 9 protein [Ignavibacterium album]AFH48474.1 Heptosyltransferase II [Ignavibacterium album JCM 16511]
MKKILFIQTAFPGDAILTLPALEKLKESNPDSQLDVLCIPTTQEIFLAAPYVDSAIVFDKKGKQKSFLSLIRFAKELKKNNYDKIYSAHRSLRTSLLVLLSEVNESYGFSNASLKYVYKNIVQYKLSKHEVQRNLDLIGFKYDDSSWRIKPFIGFSDDVIDKVNNFIKDVDTKNLIAVAPGSIWATKRYPIEKWKKIVNHFLNNRFSVVLIGGEDDEQLCDAISESCDRKIFNSAGKFSIIESINLLTRCKLLISNDSAPTHFGMCSAIKVLTIYCSTIPGFGFYPYLNDSRFVSFDQLSCKPCGIHGYQECPLGHFNCANKLSENEVIRIAEEMLNEHPNS